MELHLHVSAPKWDSTDGIAPFVGFNFFVGVVMTYTLHFRGWNPTMLQFRGMESHIGAIQWVKSQIGTIPHGCNSNETIKLVLLEEFLMLFVCIKE